jgi:hypothetical protein
VNLPTKRLTITPAEFRLLKPGMDVLACGLADVKLDLFAFELAALAFALRLGRSRKLVDITQSVSIDMKPLATKIETYRKRVKRLTIAKVGAIEYRSIAGRWRRNVAWLRYNTLYTKLPKGPKRGRAQRWRDQRQQAKQAIKTALAENFYEALDANQMARIVTLLTTTLRRCWRAVGLVDFMLDPHSHSDLLIKFVVKRIELDRLPGAPIDAWRAASNRGDAFREYQEKSRGTAVDLPNTSPGNIPVEAQLPKVIALPQVKPRRFTHNHQALTAEILAGGLAEWMYETVTFNFSFTREVCEDAKFQILNGFHEPYQGMIGAASVKGLVKELGPECLSDDRPTLIGQYANWLVVAP